MSRVVMGYYGSWATYRPAAGKVSVSDLDPSLCTHIIFSFVGITAEGNVKVIDANGLSEISRLKARNTHLKVLVAVGGWNEGSVNFSKVAADAELRENFARNAAAFLRQYNFDGLDVDWEYPADPDRGGAPIDKQTFIQLLRNLRTEFGDRYILSAAVGAGEWRRNMSYDVPQLNQCVNYINLMAYDLHGPWENRTGNNAPLKSSDHSNIEYIIRDWIQAGASPSKLVLGLASYGKTFTLANSSNHGLSAPSTGPGQPGPYTREAGSLSFTEICGKISHEGWTRVWDSEGQVPYAFRENQWVSYDDANSLKEKCNAIRRNNLAGAMVWSVDQDDVHGTYNNTTFPLLRCIVNNLR